MRQFTVLLALIVVSVFGQEQQSVIVTRVDGEPQVADPARPRETAVDLSFRFGETNVTEVRDIELFPDGTIAFGGAGSAKVGTVREDGSSEKMNFGGGTLAAGDSVAVDHRHWAVFGGGVPQISTLGLVRVADFYEEYFYNAASRVRGTARKVFVVGPESDLLSAGRLELLGQTNQFYGLVRQKQTGALDPSFTLSGAAGLDMRTATVDGSGRILATHSRTNAGTIEYEFGRWKANGERDTSYDGEWVQSLGTNAVVALIEKAPGTNGFIAAVENEPAGPGGPKTTLLIRLDEEGVPSGSPAGLPSVDGVVRAIAFEAIRAETLVTNGYDRILVGGNFSYVANTAGRNLAVISAQDGAVEWSFAPDEGPDGMVSAIAVQLDGRVLVGGAFTNVNGVAAKAMARLIGNSEASTYVYWADSEFRGFEKREAAEMVLWRSGKTNESLTVNLFFRLLGSASASDLGAVPSTVHFEAGQTAVVIRAPLQNDGFRENRERVEFRVSGTNANLLITRPVTDLVILDDETPGTIDPSFATVERPPFVSFSVQGDGKILLSGFGTSIMRLNPDGSVDAGFVTNGIPGETNSRWAIIETRPQTDGKIYVGGVFNTMTNFGINHLARLNSDGTLDASFDPKLSPISGSFDSFHEGVRFDVDAEGRVVTWLAGSRVTRQGQFPSTRLFRLLPGGSLDTFSSAIVTRDIAVLKTLPNGEMLVYSQTVGAVRRLKSNGATDTNFVAQVPVSRGFVYDMKVLGEAVLVGGSFKEINSMAVSNLVRLNLTNGAVDTNFNAQLDGEVNSIEQRDGRIYVAGTFTKVNGKDRFRLARLNTDGSLDETFDPGLGVNAGGRQFELQTNGQVLVGMDLDRVDRVPVASLVQLEGDKDFMPPGNAPTVEILWPTNGTEIVLTDVVEPFEVEVKAFDPGGFLEKVVVELDGVAVATNSTGGKFYLERPRDGEHVLTVTATDEHGMQSVETVRFRVTTRPWPGLVNLRRAADEVVLSYPSGRLQGSTDLRTWIDVHTGGGEFRPASTERYQFFRVRF